MGRLSAWILALALGACSAVGLVACGGGESADLLPGATASQIDSNLDEVRRLVDEGDCVGAEDAARQVQLQIEDLDGVDKRLKQALLAGADRLNEVVTECDEPATEETELPVETSEEVEPLENGKEKQKEKEKEAAEDGEETEPPVEEALEGNESEEEAAGEGKSTLPPQANGEGKGLEEGGGEAPPSQGGSGPSGGLGPATAAEGE
jgi:septal ring-binding cell division protein DamX